MAAVESWAAAAWVAMLSGRFESSLLTFLGAGAPKREKEECPPGSARTREVERVTKPF